MFNIIKITSLSLVVSVSLFGGQNILLASDKNTTINQADINQSGEFEGLKDINVEQEQNTTRKTNSKPLLSSKDERGIVAGIIGAKEKSMGFGAVLLSSYNADDELTNSKLTDIFRRLSLENKFSIQKQKEKKENKPRDRVLTKAEIEERKKQEAIEAVNSFSGSDIQSIICSTAGAGNCYILINGSDKNYRVGDSIGGSDKVKILGITTSSVTIGVTEKKGEKEVVVYKEEKSI